MRRRFLLILALVLSAGGTWAQSFRGTAVPARANVVAYDDEHDILKSDYGNSSYYMELDGSWSHGETDSSYVYSCQLDVEKVWKEFHVFLNVRCGRACRVSVDGREAGYADDSRQWNEFELSGFLKYGRKNTLAIEAMKHAPGALLESDDQMTGLNGQPYLIFKGDPNVSDVALTADYDASSESGTLSLDVSVFNGKKKGKYYLELEVWDPKGHTFDRMGRWMVFDKTTDAMVDLTRSWAAVEPWSAETPSLYTAVLRLRNENMEEEELVSMRFGFRRVEVKDGLLLLNGKPLTLKGVTYGVRQTVYPADRDRIRHDLLAMKRCNINAVRTARYSPMDPFFYQLCDELGLYVVCDANLLPASTQQRAVAVDKEFIPLFEHRVENLYGKYKNHPSIIAWSLGEGRDNGICMAAAYKRLKSIEKSRPVVFSGAEFSDNSDVIALMNPSPQALRQALAKSSNRPFLLLSAVKDGNFAGLEDLWDLVEGHRNLQGGFVDIWPLSEARQSDLKNLFSPFDIQLSKTTIDDASFLVFNRNDFSDFSGYILEYTVFTNHRTGITAGDLPVAIAPGGVEEVGLRIPPVALQPGEELMVRFDLERRNAPLAQRLLGTKVFELPDKNLTKRPLVNNGRLDAGSCDLSLCPGLRFGGHDDWTKEVVASSQRSPDSGIVCVDAMLRFSAAGRSMCDVRVTSTFFASGDVVVDYTLAPTDAVRGDLVPLLDVALPGQGTDTLLWFGLDREVCFARRGSGILGNYSMPRNKMYNTSRRQVRWCADRQSGGNLYVALIGEPFSVDIDTAGLTLHPVTGSASFRVHLRRFGPGDSPDDFYSTELPVVKTGILDPPIITASAPRFSQPLAVTIVLPSGHSASLPSIRYTLDGSEPDESSPLYAAPIELTTTTVVKARAYAPGIPPSFTATRKFNYDYIVKTSFSQKPNTPFNVGTDTLLFDGEHGTADDLSYGWLGFSGDGVTTTVELSKPVDIETVTLRFAHSPAMWAFAPRQVTLLLSEDGQAFSDTLSAALPFDPASADFDSPQVVELKVPVDRKGVTFLKVVARSIGALPQWHRAKGLKPWLLMDEIEVAETPKSRNNKIMQ